MDRHLEEALAVAVHLARRAGDLQLERRAGLTLHGAKAHANDLVSDVDIASEKLIVDGLREVWPSDGLLGEEGVSEGGTSGRRWVIDPLDGTRNYVSGTGPWSVCIALQRGRTTEVAVVHDPVARETFTAVSGAGARLNGEPLSASSTLRLDEALVGVSFNPSPQTKSLVGPMLSTIMPSIGDIRRLPAALQLAYLAAGRFDAGLVVDTQLWDVAAGLLVAREAGVVLSGRGGMPTPAFTIGAAAGVRAEFSRLIESALAQVSDVGPAGGGGAQAGPPE
jgi:myo-inositol-1(or 4)-monophosphatase